jgi:multimeric flavodoxin WrbA
MVHPRWKNKVAGAFTNSSSFSGDKLNTLVGLVINAMQHGMIFVGLGMLPSANKPDDMNEIAGPGPDAHNRVGSFVGPMSASSTHRTHRAKATLRRRSCTVDELQKLQFNSSVEKTPNPYEGCQGVSVSE